MVPYYLYTQGFDWKIWVFAIVLGCATSISITGGYHRLFAHRSYQTQTWVKIFYLLLGGASFQGSVLKWATDHRRHHRYVDTDKDPYNINQGFWYAHMGWLLVEDNPEYKDKFAPDLLSDKWVFLQHKYYLWVAFGVGVIFPTWVGYQLGSWLGGFLTDKFGEYYIQSWSLFLSAPIFIIMPFFSSVEMMALLIFLQSTISDTFRPANSVAITKYARPENLTKAFSLNRMAINLGFSIGPALGGILSGISYNFLFLE